MQEGAASADQASKLWSRATILMGAAGDAANEIVSEIVKNKVYVPDAAGFNVALPDTVQVRVLFCAAPAGRHRR